MWVYGVCVCGCVAVGQNCKVASLAELVAKQKKQRIGKAGEERVETVHNNCICK
jgi:hypothetical protein